MHAIDRIVNNLSVEVFLMYVFIYLRLVIFNENVNLSSSETDFSLTMFPGLLQSFNPL